MNYRTTATFVLQTQSNSRNQINQPSELEFKLVQRNTFLNGAACTEINVQFRDGEYDWTPLDSARCLMSIAEDTQEIIFKACATQCKWTDKDLGSRTAAKACAAFKEFFRFVFADSFPKPNFTNRDKAYEELFNAARGLSHGSDWNSGTMAILHGYRRRLIEAVAALKPGDSPTTNERAEHSAKLRLLCAKIVTEMSLDGVDPLKMAFVMEKLQP